MRRRLSSILGMSEVMTMKPWRIVLALIFLVGSPLVFTAPAAQVPRAQVIVLSNSSPHVSVIDAETNRIVKTADMPGMTSWGWNDENNYYDGTNLWLGMRNPDTDDVEVVLLDLDTLRVTRRIPLGKDATTLYIGKPSRTGRVFVAKHASGQLAVVDTRTFTVTTVNLPVNGGVACDVDVAQGPDGVERVFIPTRNANTVLSVDSRTLRVLGTLRFPGTEPFMLTASPNGRQVWVEERTGGSEAVVDTVTLSVLRRVPVGKTPIIGAFSPDGRLHITGHAADTVVVAYDTKTLREAWRAQAGTYPEKVGVHPAGTFVYAILSREGAVAVLDARTGKAIGRISLGTNPTGIFVRRLK
ncbi:MAG TPA: YncE family protein [bacterium]|nr:YncE family protein [bacterium]